MPPQQRLLRSAAAAHAEERQLAFRLDVLEQRVEALQEEVASMPHVRMLDPAATRCLFDAVMLRFALTLVAGCSAAAFVYAKFIR